MGVQFSEPVFRYKPDLYLYVDAQVDCLCDVMLRMMSELAIWGLIMAAARAAGNIGLVAAPRAQLLLQKIHFKDRRKGLTEKYGPSVLATIIPLCRSQGATWNEQGRSGPKRIFVRQKSAVNERAVSSAFQVYGELGELEGVATAKMR